MKLSAVRFLTFCWNSLKKTFLFKSKKEIKENVKRRTMKSFSFFCKGHEKVLGTHKTTIEITTDTDLSLKGDCIIGINASSSLSVLPETIKNSIRSLNAEIVLLIEVDKYCEKILGKGHPNLLLSDKRAIIVRKSNFVCPRTLMINADKSASQLSREMIDKMTNPEMEMKVTIEIYRGETSTSKQT